MLLHICPIESSSVDTDMENIAQYIYMYYNVIYTQSKQQGRWVNGFQWLTQKLFLSWMTYWEMCLQLSLQLFHLLKVRNLTGNGIAMPSADIAMENRLPMKNIIYLLRLMISIAMLVYSKVLYLAIHWWWWMCKSCCIYDIAPTSWSEYVYTISVHLYICIYIYIHVYMNVCYTCVYIYIYMIHRHAWETATVNTRGQRHDVLSPSPPWSKIEKTPLKQKRSIGYFMSVQ